ncbi:MAG: pyrroline-5-carboxylate reductase [Armatimonadetes bacterium]|nr:pyrroline-5-carboxylate reductase [Armatimonadota bacterium]
MAHKYTLGVIGTGNMGSAFVRRVIGVSAVPADKVVLADADEQRVQALAQELGAQVADSNVDLASQSEYVLLAVKPGVVPSVLGEISGALTAEQTIVSFAAGVSLEKLGAGLGKSGPSLVRIMPNTPALVGAGVFAVAAPGVAQERVEKLEEMLRAAGEVVQVEEKLMDAITGLIGSGPAFVFVLIEALADGAVAAGLPRPMAQELAVQTVVGAGRLVQETGQHPAALKDAVASPGGTTIAGLAELERGGFRALAAAAVRAAAKRSEELAKG